VVLGHSRRAAACTVAVGYTSYAPESGGCVVVTEAVLFVRETATLHTSAL